MFQIATISEQHSLNTDLLVLFLDENFCKKRKKNFDIFPASVAKYLKKYLLYKDFKGEFKETRLLYPEDHSGISRILLVGLGDISKLDPEKLRTIGFHISSSQEQTSGKRHHIFLANVEFCREDLIRAMAEGILYQNYRFEDFKSDKKKQKKGNQYIFVCHKEEYTPRYRKALLETMAAMNSVELTRNLANQPSNILTPGKLKDFIVSHFEQYDDISVDYLDGKQLKKEKMNALLAVAKGSTEPPYLIIIKYKPAKESKKKLAIVGKGVTFDSGGISIKPSAGMEEMKYDMAGAAATVGIMDVFARLKPKFEVIGLIPAVENMPDGNSLKPGDVIRAYNQKTIEIINTDAEGRLILADTLSYAEKNFKPDAIIDFATLTGACVVALGDKMAGLFANSDEMANILNKAGEQSGDYLWRMPLSDNYSEDLKSEIADIKNLGGRWGGAITAAKFLESFIKKVRWTHIDMAGTAYNIKGLDYLPTGATGFGPKLIASAMKDLEKFL